MPREITFTTDALTNLNRLIESVGERDRADASESYPFTATKEEQARWQDAFHARQIERRNNALGVLKTLIGLGGEIVADGETDLMGRNEFLTYGVNKNRHNDVLTWSVNS